MTTLIQNLRSSFQQDWTHGNKANWYNEPPVYNETPVHAWLTTEITLSTSVCFLSSSSSSSCLILSSCSSSAAFRTFCGLVECKSKEGRAGIDKK